MFNPRRIHRQVYKKYQFQFLVSIRYNVKATRVRRVVDLDPGMISSGSSSGKCLDADFASPKGRIRIYSKCPESKLFGIHDEV